MGFYRDRKPSEFAMLGTLFPTGVNRQQICRGLHLIDVSISVYLHGKKKGARAIFTPFFDCNLVSEG